MTNIPKNLQKKIEEISDERDSDDGIFAYYKAGWKSSLDIAPVHFEHENTIKEISELVKLAVPCNCKDCQTK